MAPKWRYRAEEAQGSPAPGALAPKAPSDVFGALATEPWNDGELLEGGFSKSIPAFP